MKYSELIQAYFERSVALQWYWTLYVIVIGGVLAFSTFRQHKDILSTILVMALYVCFAFKNEGAIEATAIEREAILAAIKDPEAWKPGAADIQRVRDIIEPTMTPYDVAGVRYFHVACDLMTIAVIGVKELRRRKLPPGPEPATA
jgi:hypothetical protein